MSDSDLAFVRRGLEVARSHGFAEVELESDGVKFAAKLEPMKAVHSAIVSALKEPPAEAALADSGLAEILSPCVGFFHEGGTPMEPGARVEKDAVVASIQALGIANDVVSPCGGEIEEVLIKKGEPVEYGQPLARVKVAT